MNTTGNYISKETDEVNSQYSKINVGSHGTLTDNNSIRNLQSANSYQFARFADSKEMEEGIERILGDNSFA